MKDGGLNDDSSWRIAILKNDSATVSAGRVPSRFRSILVVYRPGGSTARHTLAAALESSLGMIRVYLPIFLAQGTAPLLLANSPSLHQNRICRWGGLPTRPIPRPSG